MSSPEVMVNRAWAVDWHVPVTWVSRHTFQRCRDMVSGLLGSEKALVRF